MTAVPPVQVADISANMVRLMVSTTLVTVTRLSKLVFDKEKGLKRKHKKQGAQNDIMTTIAEEASEEDGVINDIQVAGVLTLLFRRSVGWPGRWLERCLGSNLIRAQIF